MSARLDRLDKLLNNQIFQLQADNRVFRALVIGKTGCGKTTILEKICGGSMKYKGGESRGIHEIERELVADGNNRFVAHDSQGFEGGSTREYQIVQEFLRKRERMPRDERVHVIWYCLQASSRPIQVAEQRFFSEYSGQAPVIAILTKFDILLDECQQEVEETMDFDADDEEDEDQILAAASIIAERKFQEGYRDPLMAMPRPPSAVIRVANVNVESGDREKSGPLRELLDVTLESLQKQDFGLSILFASAQRASSFIRYFWELSILTAQASKKPVDVPWQRRKLVWNFLEYPSLVSTEGPAKIINHTLETVVDRRPHEIYGSTPQTKSLLLSCQVFCDTFVLFTCMKNWGHTQSELSELCNLYVSSRSSRELQVSLLKEPKEKWERYPRDMCEALERLSLKIYDRFTKEIQR